MEQPRMEKDRAESYIAIYKLKKINVRSQRSDRVIRVERNFRMRAFVVRNFRSHKLSSAVMMISDHKLNFFLRIIFSSSWLNVERVYQYFRLSSVRN